VTPVSDVERAVSCIEPGQPHRGAGGGPAPVPALLERDVVLPQGIAEEELAALAAEGPGLAHPTHQVRAGVSRFRELRGPRAPGGALAGRWRPRA
jgi:hypothetical protein